MRGARFGLGRSLARALGVVALVSCALGVGPGAWADGGDAEEAERLRTAATEDWKAQRHRDAADKLRKAAAIYERAPDAHVDDLAATRRALVWNLVKAGAVDEASAPFDAMLKAAAAAPTARLQLLFAYTALYEAARDAGSVAGARAVLDRVRTKALDAGDAGVAAQVLHDLGSISSERGDPDGAAKLFEQAISERRAAKSLPDLAWSLNNLANVHLAQGRLDPALAPLLEAHRLVTSEQFLPPQAAVAANTKTVLDRLTTAEAPTVAQRAWVWDVAEVTAASELPSVHRPEVLLRAALRLEAAAGGPTERLAASRRLAALVLTPTAAPKEIRADLLLHAARLALEHGGATDALGWLASIDVGTGPAAPHLAARRGVATALARIAQQQAAEATAVIAETRAALTSVGDLGLRETSLDAMAAAAGKAGLAAVAASLREELETTRRVGRPGARGASARSGGDAAKFRELGFHNAVFELQVEGGKVRVTDLLTEASVDLDGTWQPQAVALDGLTVRAFGPYVRIEGFAYAAGASAVASGGTTVTLAELEPYLVVPGQGVLRVLKNGALTYGP